MTEPMLKHGIRQYKDPGHDHMAGQLSFLSLLESTDKTSMS